MAVFPPQGKSTVSEDSSMACFIYSWCKTRISNIIYYYLMFASCVILSRLLDLPPLCGSVYSSVKRG